MQGERIQYDVFRDELLRPAQRVRNETATAIEDAANSLELMASLREYDDAAAEQLQIELETLKRLQARNAIRLRHLQSAENMRDADDFVTLVPGVSSLMRTGN